MTPAEYDAWYDTDRGRWIGETEYRLLSAMLAPSHGESVLDVGCGTGWFARRMAADGQSCLTGVDLDFPSLAFARQRRADIACVQADACRLPFGDNSFERVMSVAALNFVADWPQALAEIVRVANRRFAVGLLHRHSLLWLAKGREDDDGDYRGAHWHSRREILGALTGLPVEHVRIRSAVLFPGGSPMARFAERHLPQTVPFGALIVVAADKRHDGV